MPALLFDLDGTLLDTDPLHARVFIDIFARHGREIDEAFYTAQIHGRQNRDIFQLLPGTDPQALADEKEAAFRDLLGTEAEPAAGLRPLLARARAAGWPMAVVTNAPRANADAMLRAIDLSDAFDTIVIGDELPRGKPDPMPYQVALDRLDLSPDAAVAFEDSGSGIRAAVAAGLRTVGLTSSLSPDELRAHGATDVIDDFDDPALAAILSPSEGARQ
ncbi:HAD family phosphatase [Mesobaculum littorinae]|uniref:HAD family phosphatase n=1 Tax=Mesobaculum littorinae TaxID=2486419 RepID=A0A438AJQ8_9RHOB|nr:HAD family phosphatase [Mesobaculum littorinae]RVV99021.1 HAD family phosphatase [Mesobaculum littorinae]